MEQVAAEVVGASFRETFLHNPKALVLCLPALIHMLTGARTASAQHNSSVALQASVASIVTVRRYAFCSSMVLMLNP